MASGSYPMNRFLLLITCAFLGILVSSCAQNPQCVVPEPTYGSPPGGYGSRGYGPPPGDPQYGTRPGGYGQPPGGYGANHGHYGPPAHDYQHDYDLSRAAHQRAKPAAR